MTGVVCVCGCGALASLEVTDRVADVTYAYSFDCYRDAWAGAGSLTIRQLR